MYVCMFKNGRGPELIHACLELVTLKASRHVTLFITESVSCSGEKGAGGGMSGGDKEVASLWIQKLFFSDSVNRDAPPWFTVQ